MSYPISAQASELAQALEVVPPHPVPGCARPAYRMALQTIYATGLRVSEACALRVGDIDSATDRMCVRVNALTHDGVVFSDTRR